MQTQQMTREKTVHDAAARMTGHLPCIIQAAQTVLEKQPGLDNPNCIQARRVLIHARALGNLFDAFRSNPDSVDMDKLLYLAFELGEAYTDMLCTFLEPLVLAGHKCIAASHSSKVQRQAAAASKHARLQALADGIWKKNRKLSTLRVASLIAKSVEGTDDETAAERVRQIIKKPKSW